ncbi:MAG: DUF2795 domain-containing protein [Chloroflexi bacterium]|nr:DUF2795 domain-containing protein [Chloroflexota bacterium]MCL5110294.1 DUF2795 domain-containing protein [Chloroflexota bacterium]MDA8216539.1 DUF2795 domain-containing protein [Dehalococcoidales bacterium]
MERGSRVAPYLQGLDFPATRDRMIGYAIGRNAPEDVVEILQKLPDRQFNSLNNVWDTLEQDMG